MTDPFTYFLSADDTPITPAHDIWGGAVPLSRNKQSAAAGIAVSYGDYFQAVRRFLEKNQFKALSTAASAHLHTRVTHEEIAQIQVILEKHGEFYHPSKIQTVIRGRTLHFVVNAAISALGRDSIEREYGLLKHLGETKRSSFIPQVYALDAVLTENGSEISMFIGEWFERYSEFHYTHSPEGGKTIVVWDAEKDHYFLSEDQLWALYQEVARILTYYYHPTTFEQIYPWHHAAGDFVVALKSGIVDVKLVTVRGLQSPLEPGEMEKSNQNLQSMMEAMLVFFLNLSIRTRLDRIDGVGEVVWSHDSAVQGTVDGFFSSLAAKPQVRVTPVPLNECFHYYFSTYNERDLYDLAQEIVKAYHPLAPEVPVIKKNLEPHIKELIFAVKHR